MYTCTKNRESPPLIEFSPFRLVNLSQTSRRQMRQHAKSAFRVLHVLLGEREYYEPPLLCRAATSLITFSRRANDAWFSAFARAVISGPARSGEPQSNGG